MMGISKRELLQDYYPDELAAVFSAWAEMHGAGVECGAQAVTAEEFLEM